VLVDFMVGELKSFKTAVFEILKFQKYLYFENMCFCKCLFF
jgi:hypothetical protein